MSARNYSNTATQAALTGSITSADASFTVASFAGFPAAPFTAALDRGTASEEIVLVTAVSGSTITATRGYDGTTAKSHAAGAQFLHVTVAMDYAEANSHVNATAGVHGVTGALVGATQVQTLTNKTLTTPTVTAPTVTGTATLASATLSGTLSVAGSATLAALVATTGTFSGNVAVTGTLSAAATTLASLTVSGAATLASGTVTATPTLAAHLVRKDYADALGDTANTANTIVRRSAASAISALILNGLADNPTSGDWAANKNYVDSKIAAIVAAKFQAGRVSATITGASSSVGTITFPTAFAGAPYVVLQVESGGTADLIANIVSTPTTTTFSWRVKERSATVGTYAVSLVWFAFLP